MEQTPQPMSLDQAIVMLDVANDDHWTMNGLPMVFTLQELTQNGDLKRSDITNAAPNLTRETWVDIYGEAAAASAAAAVGVALGDGAAVERERPAVAEAVSVDMGTPVIDGIEIPEGGVMDLPASVIFRSVALIDLAIVEVDEQSTDLLRQRTEINEKLRQLSTKSQLLERTKIMHQGRGGRNSGNEAVKAFQEASRKRREEQVRKAQEFISAGTSAKDVMNQLDPRSPIDKALMAKNKGRQTRPSMPMLGQSGR